MIAKIIGWIVIAIAAVIGLAFLFTIPVYFLWNWLMPTIFNLPTISFLQAWGLLVLCGFLFRSGSTSKN